MYMIFQDNDLIYSPSMSDQGFGIVSGKLTIELNRAGSLEFTLPTNNEMYNNIALMTSTIKVFDDVTLIWHGRVLNATVDFYKRKKVYCEGALAFLSDTISGRWAMSLDTDDDNKNYADPYGMAQIIINDHNRMSSRKFSVRRYTDRAYWTAKIYDKAYFSFSDFEGCYDRLSGILADYGGYAHTDLANDGTTLLYLNGAPGVTSSQKIVFGENLLDLEQYINAGEVYTAVLPQGKRLDGTDDYPGRRIVIGNSEESWYLVNETGVNRYGFIARQAVWDDVEDVAALRKLGQDVLSQGISGAATISIKAVDLHHLDVNVARIKVGSYVEVISPHHGIDENFVCNKQEINLTKLSDSVYSFGARRKTLTDKIALANTVQSKGINALGVKVAKLTTS